jgi:hypothetical protein
MPWISRAEYDRLTSDASQSDTHAQQRDDLTTTIAALLVVTPHMDALAVIQRLAASDVYTSEAAAYLLDANPAYPEPRAPEAPFIPDGDIRALMKARAAVSILWGALTRGHVNTEGARHLIKEFGDTVDGFPEELAADPEFVKTVEGSLAVSYGIEPPETDFEGWEAMHRRAAERLAKTLGMGKRAATLV